VTTGCGDGTVFCPAANVLRQKMAVFLIKAANQPWPCAWAVQRHSVRRHLHRTSKLANLGVTAGCQANPDSTRPYVAEANVLRQEWRYSDQCIGPRPMPAPGCSTTFLRQRLYPSRIANQIGGRMSEQPGIRPPYLPGRTFSARRWRCSDQDLRPRAVSPRQTRVAPALS
jgi:hypothetical protein